MLLSPLQHSESQSFRTALRKEGIRIRNVNLKLFFKHFRFNTFREQLAGKLVFRFQTGDGKNG